MGCFVLHQYQLFAIQKQIGSALVEHFEQQSSFRLESKTSFFTVEIPSDTETNEGSNFIVGLVSCYPQQSSQNIAQTIKEFIKNSIYFQTKQYFELIDNVLLMFREPFRSTELFGSWIEIEKESQKKQSMTINIMMKLGNEIFISRNLNIKDHLIQTNQNKWILSFDGKKYIELEEGKNLKEVSNTMLQIDQDSVKPSIFATLFDGSAKQISQIILTDGLNKTEFVCKDLRKQYPKREVSSSNSKMHCIKIHFDKKETKK